MEGTYTTEGNKITFDFGFDDKQIGEFNIKGKTLTFLMTDSWTNNGISFREETSSILERVD